MSKGNCATVQIASKGVTTFGDETWKKNMEICNEKYVHLNKALQKSAYILRSMHDEFPYSSLFVHRL